MSPHTGSHRRRRSRAQRAGCGLLALVFYLSLGAPYAARAQGGDGPVEVEAAPAADDTPAVVREVGAATGTGTEAGTETETGTEAEAEAETEADSETETMAERPRTVQAAPDASAKNAVTPQAISLPKAEGSIEGMGESFSPNLSAGTGTFAVPIALPPGRGGVQPSLGLGYSTSQGNGPLGVGWSMQVPFIARQTDRGLPRYLDRASWHPEEDRFIYNGGQELVPVDSAAAAALDGGAIPADLRGFQQYRARVEGAFMRFFRSPDSTRWVVQDKNGMRFDFGVLRAGDGPSEMAAASLDSLLSEFDGGTGRIFQWNLTRMSDVHGSSVYYRYLADEGQRYLRDIHYVSPLACAATTPAEQRACAEPLSSYARKVKLVYEGRDDVFDNYTTSWRVATGLRVRRIEVTSYDSAARARTLVRRYHLRYDPTSFLSLLEEVQVEGRPDSLDPDAQVFAGDRFVGEAALGEGIVGRLLPPMRFAYSSPAATSAILPGFGGFDATVYESPASPGVSVSDERADLFDVNSDGLPDLIVTDPARNRTASGGPAVGVYFNGFSGRDATPAVAGGFSEPVPMAVPSGLSSRLNLANLNLNPMDIDGDGKSDLLHMPRLTTYGYFSPGRAPDGAIAEVSPADQGWSWAYKQVELERGIDPRIDFGRDGERLQVLDVNNDHLVDVVRTTGTVMQTFLNLGWLPGGDGRFGSARYGTGGFELSTEPIESCVLQLGLPLDFADPEVRLADMNGDGIQDIVKLRQGRVAYWPGRGPGLWGQGDAECPQGAGEGREVEMFDPPAELNVELESVYLADLNMDGASDLVQVRFDEIDIWLNVAGRGFTERVTLGDTPAAPGYARRIRFADLDGSGTTDIVYGTADHWRYIDPMGGQRPRLLVGVENGLGGLTELEYDSSAEEYLRDLREAERCRDSQCERFTWSHVGGGCELKFEDQCVYRAGGSPVVSTVVTAVETRDQLDAIAGQREFSKRTEYRYHDGYYEGIEQELRGFGAADAVEIGDEAHPTSITRTFFHQGRRPNEIASERLADNPNEALKGRSYLTEVFDEQGVYLSSKHATMTVRELLQGLDGRAVSYAFVSRSDELRYDTDAFTAGGEALEVTRVVRERADGDLLGVAAGAEVSAPPESGLLRIRGAGYAHLSSTVDVVDNAGNMRRQTAHGRLRGEHGELPGDFPAEEIVKLSTPVLCNAEQYVWRVASEHIEGHGDSTPLGLTTHRYDPIGCDLLSSTTAADLPEALPSGFDFGGGLPGYAQEDQLLVSSSRYDAWGNAVASCAGGDLAVDGQDACLRYAEVDYDARYAQFPVAERIATARSGASFAMLETLAAWDEGLAVLTQVVDANGLATRVSYDGLGRLTSLTPPPSHDIDVADACRTSRVPVTRIDYALSNELGAPINRIVSTTEQDCSAIGADALQSVAFVDGLGRTRVSLVQAEGEGAANATLAQRWQQSGLVRFSARGQVVESLQPAFLPNSGELPSAGRALSPGAAVPSSFAFYDAFGRIVAAVAEDGSTARSVYHALSTDVWDPNDLDPASPHYATFGSERRDGHGRVIDQVLRNRRVGRSDIEYTGCGATTAPTVRSRPSPEPRRCSTGRGIRRAWSQARASTSARAASSTTARAGTSAAAIPTPTRATRARTRAIAAGATSTTASATSRPCATRAAAGRTSSTTTPGAWSPSTTSRATRRSRTPRPRSKTCPRARSASKKATAWGCPPTRATHSTPTRAGRASSVRCPRRPRARSAGRPR